MTPKEFVDAFGVAHDYSYTDHNGDTVTRFTPQGLEIASRLESALLEALGQGRMTPDNIDDMKAHVIRRLQGEL